MSNLGGYRPKLLANKLKKKLNIDFGKGSELFGWYYLDGKKVLSVSIPKGHSKDISPGYINKIAGNLRVNLSELRLLYRCPMTGANYESKIRDLISQNRLYL